MKRRPVGFIGGPSFDEFRLRLELGVTVAEADETKAPTATKQSSIRLVEFQHVHTALLKSMTQLDELTRGPLPSKAHIVEARWEISRKSLSRRMLWSRVYTDLSCRVPNEHAADLHQLQQIDLTLLRSSSEHVSKWHIDAILDE